MSAAQPSPELAADVDDVFLGWWPDGLMWLVRRAYQPGALLAYAYRDGGVHLPAEEPNP